MALANNQNIGHAPNDIFIGPKYVANHGKPSLRWEIQWGQSMVRKPMVGIHHLRTEAQLIYCASILSYVIHRYLPLIIATSISCLFWNSFSQVSPHSLCRTTERFFTKLVELFMLTGPTLCKTT